MIQSVLIGLALLLFLRARTTQQRSLALLGTILSIEGARRAISFVASGGADAGLPGVPLGRAAIGAAIAVSLLCLVQSRLSRNLKAKRLDAASLRRGPSLEAVARAIRVLGTQGFVLASTSLAITIANLDGLPSAPSLSLQVTFYVTWASLLVAVLIRRGRTDGPRPVALTLTTFAVAALLYVQVAT